MVERRQFNPFRDETVQFCYVFQPMVLLSADFVSPRREIGNRRAARSKPARRVATVALSYTRISGKSTYRSFHMNFFFTLVSNLLVTMMRGNNLRHAGKSRKSWLRYIESHGREQKCRRKADSQTPIVQTCSILRKISRRILPPIWNNRSCYSFCRIVSFASDFRVVFPFIYAGNYVILTFYSMCIALL